MPSAPDLPAYTISSTGNFAAHPSTILAQNQSLLRRLEEQAEDGRKKVDAWERSIEERELQERRRRAPGWLDREERLLEPEKAKGEEVPPRNLMDEQDEVSAGGEKAEEKDVEDLGSALDRAFGRSEMG